MRIIANPTYGILKNIPHKQKVKIRGKHGIYEGYILIPEDEYNNYICLCDNIERDDKDNSRYIGIKNIKWLEYIDEIMYGINTVDGK